jgi:hypothetical protein
MSKGHGSVQRRVLEALERFDEPISTIMLAMFAYGLYGDEAYLAITEAQLTAVRRALNSLCAGGLVDAGPRGSNGSRFWRRSTSTALFPKSNRQIAREIGISHVTVGRAREALMKGNDE